ncbi:MAG TPA: Crp/Fnr family transcriptional regulator [Thermomicrobiales bacterium]|jgi:CRP/FNR family transcriptional regulator|nr:Crp/Fnr family transcriptional regulator [Thermomicrobiales bacterium]
MMSSMNHRLGDVPLFAGLPPAVLDELARESRVRRYPAGQVLWHEGDPGDALLVLEEGQLRISRFTATGAEVVLAVEEAPAAVGELALLDGAPRSASVIAQRPVVVRLAPRSVFLALLRREPAVVEGLLRTLAAMIRAANARHVATVGLDVPGRLAAWLLARGPSEAGAPRGPIEIEIGRSQGELALELGATRSTLNRAIKGFERLGILSVRGQTIVLHDAAALAPFTEGPADF